MRSRLIQFWRAWREQLALRRLARAFDRRKATYELVSALITALVVINSIASGVELGNTAYQVQVKTKLADDIEAMVTAWDASIDERERQYRIYEGQGISPYRATLERELLKQFRPQAQALADRIRNARDDEIAQYGLGQVLQGITSSFGGRAAGGVLGKEAGDAVGKLLEWEWNAASLAQGSDDGLAVNWEAKENLMRQLMGHLADTELDSWEKAEPLLRARAYGAIRYLQLNRGQWSEEEYAQEVRERALSLAGEFSLLQPHSNDSPFADYTQFISWLAMQAGQPLPGDESADAPPMPEPSPTPTEAASEPAHKVVDVTAEYARIWNACKNTELACRDAYCAQYDDSDMCHTYCARCDSDTLMALFDEDIWAQDDAVAACSLSAAEAYLAEVQRVQAGVAAGTLKPADGFRAETLARQAAQEANEKCIGSACQTVCAMQGKAYAVVYGMCKCK